MYCITYVLFHMKHTYINKYAFIHSIASKLTIVNGKHKTICLLKQNGTAEKILKLSTVFDSKRTKYNATSNNNNHDNNHQSETTNN